MSFNYLSIQQKMADFNPKKNFLLPQKYMFGNTFISGSNQFKPKSHVKQKKIVKLNTVDKINQYELYENGIKSILKEKAIETGVYYNRNLFQPFLNQKNSLHFSSFLYRLTHSYQDYISKFEKFEDQKMDEDMISRDEDFYSDEFMQFDVLPQPLVFKGDPKLKLDNLQDEKIEIEILINYVRNYESLYPNEPCFPDNATNFLYNFFCYLFHHRYDLDKIISLDDENR